jgi:hypothetical protein
VVEGGLVQGADEGADVGVGVGDAVQVRLRDLGGADLARLQQPLQADGVGGHERVHLGLLHDPRDAEAALFRLGSGRGGLVGRQRRLRRVVAVDVA